MRPAQGGLSSRAWVTSKGAVRARSRSAGWDAADFPLRAKDGSPAWCVALTRGEAGGIRTIWTPAPTRDDAWAEARRLAERTSAEAVVET